MSQTTPHPSLYGPAAWPALTERVLARSWHVIARIDEVPPGSVHPVTLLPGVLDEPILLVREFPSQNADSGAGGDTSTDHPNIRAFANVCTHRSARLCTAPGAITTIRCPYHGRQFGLDGRCKSAPGFETFSPEDNLAPVAVATWGPLIFVSIDPAMPFAELFPSEILDPLWNPASVHDPAGDCTYDVEANFLLWCENFLEGFHIPFVHPGLNRAIDWRTYETRLYGWSSLQLAPSETGPKVELDGRPYAGAYVALFPTTALNFYPWGLSLNIVEPLSAARTRVRYQRFVHRPDLLNTGAGAGLDTIEAEDDHIVAEVQRGVQSRLARPGRYADRWESGVAHFHAGIARLLG